MFLVRFDSKHHSQKLWSCWAWSVHLTTLFFLGKLEKALNQYFVHILSLDRKNYFTIKLHGSMEPCQGGTCVPWICSQKPLCSQKLPTALHGPIDLQRDPNHCQQSRCVVSLTKTLICCLELVQLRKTSPNRT